MRVVKKIPDPFLFKDGSRVQNADDWMKRRKEIKEEVLGIEYGTMPEAPDIVKMKIIESAEEDGHVFFEKIRFTFTPEKNQPDIKFGMDVSIRYPYEDSLEERKEKTPNFGENGLPVVIYVGTNPLFEMIENGYAVIGFENNQLDPMEMGNPIVGSAQQAYEKLEPGKYSWGSISVWAWGALRLVDYVYSESKFDENKIAISGHSRNGKTALLAGALDDRIEIVNPAGSGCAGAGSYLVLGEGCEDLVSLTDRRRWWAWTHKDFEKYAYEERGESKLKLPFDQHFLMGLVAPRPLLRTEGSTDTWANPEGTSVAFFATQEIYDFLNVSDNNQLFIRPGGHFQGPEDISALLSLCEQEFYDISQERIFKDSLIDKSEIKTYFDWEKP